MSISTILALVCAGFCVTLGAASALGEHSLASSIASLLLFYLLVLLLIGAKPNFAISIPIVFGFAWLAASVLYLEIGTLAPEIQQETNANGSTSRLVALLAVFLLSVFSTLPSRQRAPSARFQRLEKSIFVFYCLLIITWTINGLVFGFPLFSSQQRFFYWVDHPLSSILPKTLALAGYFFLFVGWRLGIQRLQNLSFVYSTRAWTYVLTLTIIFGILYSNKASFFMVITLHLISGYLLAISSICGKANIAKFLPIGRTALAFGLILGLVALSYRFIHNYPTSELAQQIFRRLLAMQGQLWWAVDNVGSTTTGNVTDMIVKKSESEPHGIFIMMKEVMPLEAFEFYFKNGVPLTGGFPASLVFYFSFYVSIILSSLLGGLIGLIYRGTILAMAQGRHDFFVWMIIFASCSWITSLGSLNILTSKVFIGCIVGLFAWRIVALCRFQWKLTSQQT